MERRAFLTANGALAATLSGCLGGSDSEPTDVNPNTGYPPDSAVESTPDSRDVDPESFERLSVGGVEVPLVPVDVAHSWFQRREARFADARGEGQYQQSHVTGAVLSSARRVENWELPREGPTADWPEGDRIVCYCGCPHHLSSLRAGEFLQSGHDRVYAIDEGFFEWRDRGYAVTGTAEQQSYVLQGKSDPGDAGSYAWATHEASDQREATPIEADGRFQMTLHFGALAPTAPIQVRTPSYELTAPLPELTDSIIRGPEN